MLTVHVKLYFADTNLLMKKLGVVVIILFLVGNCNLPSKEGLRFNLQTGKTYEFKTSYLVTRGFENKILSNISNQYSIEVMEKSGNISTLKVTYDDFFMGSVTDTLENEPDTSHQKESFDPGSLLNSIYRSLKGKSFYMVVNAVGNVVEVRGLKELLMPVIDTLPIPLKMKEMGKQMFTSDFGVGLIAKTFSQGFDIFPNKPVKTGDSWEKEIQLNGLIPISANTVYTVKEIKNGQVKLDAKSLLENNNRKGEVISTYLVDMDTGLILDATMNTKFGIPVMVSSTARITGREK
jgi:hypothetical protein